MLMNMGWGSIAWSGIPAPPLEGGYLGSVILGSSNLSFFPSVEWTWLPPQLWLGSGDCISGFLGLVGEVHLDIPPLSTATAPHPSSNARTLWTSLTEATSLSPKRKGVVSVVGLLPGLLYLASPLLHPLPPSFMLVATSPVLEQFQTSPNGALASWDSLSKDCGPTSLKTSPPSPNHSEAAFPSPPRPDPTFFIF